ncbi:hypothetical protein EZS27_010609 [termite gut metagenome]|uniref:Uncharacterized protein n=1 Tax=termite gut metagenome TaxID=433724 RepID=A0A5J4S6B6_9ZZZZ
MRYENGMFGIFCSMGGLGFHPKKEAAHSWTASFAVVHLPAFNYKLSV